MFYVESALTVVYLNQELKHFRRIVSVLVKSHCSPDLTLVHKIEILNWSLDLLLDILPDSIDDIGNYDPSLLHERLVLLDSKLLVRFN